MWPSEELASRIFDLANIGLIVSLVLGVICTAMVVRMGNAKEAYLNQRVADSNARPPKLNRKQKKSVWPACELKKN